MRRVHKITSESYYGLSKIQVELDPATPAAEIPQLWDELRRSFFILCHFGEIALILCTEVFVLHDLRDFRLFGEIFKQQ